MHSASDSPRVAVIGEALVDVLTDDSALVGGSPLNVAVGLSRLGLSATLHSRIGADHYGGLILDRLQHENVSTSPGFADSGRTSTATVTLDSRGIANYSFDLDWDIPVPDISTATIVHTGSIAAVLEPGGTLVREAIRKAAPDVLRTYDPNIRAEIMGQPDATRVKVYELASSCHVVKLSDEDAQWIGADAGLSPIEVLQKIADAGTRFAVLTTGEHGCTAIVDGRVHALPARTVDLIDTIGAGDAFMSGLIYALTHSGLVEQLLNSDSTELLPENLVVEALDTALVSSSVAVSRAGSQPPTRKELDEAWASLPMPPTGEPL
jgi:fructokinase